MNNLERLQADSFVEILDTDAFVNEYIDHKLARLSERHNLNLTVIAAVSIGANEWDDVDREIYVLSDLEYEWYYTPTQLENAIDDLLDPAGVQAENESYRRDQEYVFGPMDDPNDASDVERPQY